MYTNRPILMYIFVCISSYGHRYQKDKDINSSAKDKLKPQWSRLGKKTVVYASWNTRIYICTSMPIWKGYGVTNAFVTGTKSKSIWCSFGIDEYTDTHSHTVSHIACYSHVLEIPIQSHPVSLLLSRDFERMLWVEGFWWGEYWDPMSAYLCNKH